GADRERPAVRSSAVARGPGDAVGGPLARVELPVLGALDPRAMARRRFRRARYGRLLARGRCEPAALLLRERAAEERQAARAGAADIRRRADPARVEPRAHRSRGARADARARR